MLHDLFNIRLNEGWEFEIRIINDEQMIIMLSIPHLVLSFSRHFGSRKNHTQFSPQGILLDFFTNKVTNAFRDAKQELGAWGDAVRVECPRVGIDDSDVGAIDGYDFFTFRGLGQILGRAKSTRSLLIKLGTRCNSVDGYIL
jgi:hypothetical protein